MKRNLVVFLLLGALLLCVIACGSVEAPEAVGGKASTKQESEGIFKRNPSSSEIHYYSAVGKVLRVDTFEDSVAFAGDLYTAPYEAFFDYTYRSSNLHPPDDVKDAMSIMCIFSDMGPECRWVFGPIPLPPGIWFAVDASGEILREGFFGPYVIPDLTGASKMCSMLIEQQWVPLECMEVDPETGELLIGGEG